MNARFVAIATVALTTVGCAHEVHVNTDRTGAVSAVNYATFFTLDGNSSGNRVIDQEITRDIENALAERGMVKTSPEEGEAVVVAHTATAATHSRDAFYGGWGGWRWRQDDAGTRPVTENYRPGALVIDVFDARTKSLIWHSSAPDAISAHAAAHPDALDRTITHMLKDFAWPSFSAGEASSGSARAEWEIGVDHTPDIIFSTSPATLIRIDGNPVYRDVDGTRLQRVVNTGATILRDESATYYMKLGDRWLESYTLMGPWSIAGALPEGLGGSDTYGSSTPETGPLPAVFVATAPAALIVTDGDPQFAPVGNTSLTYVRNTSACVFREPTDKELYVLVSGNWSRSWATNGPWEQIAADKLPSDLRTIHPRETCAASTLRAR